MKKILFVLPGLSVGGLERVQVNLANALVERDYDVTILALNPQADLKVELSPKVHYRYQPCKPHPIGGRIPYLRHKFYDDGMWETRASAKELYQYYVGNEKFDVEIGFFRGLSVKIVSGSTNPRSVKLAWVHSDFKHCGGITNNFKNMAAVRAAYGKFDRIVCVSDRAKRSFEEVIGYPDKTARIYNLLPAEKIRALGGEVCPARKRKATICSVGHLLPVKGYDRLIGAVKRLNAEGKGLALWLVGGGEEEKALRELAAGDENISFFGSQPNPYPYMKQADLYVCSSRYEGFNLTVAEALILGVPVLSTDCTGPTEILDGGRYGKIVENSEEGLYKGMKELLETPDLLEQYQSKTQERAAFFDEDEIVKQVTVLFEKG